MPEVVLQVEMDPLIDRIPRQLRKNRGHGQEFRLRFGAAGDQVFGHAALAEHLPDVMVGCGEQLPGVPVVVVFRNLLQIRVVVRVDDRKILDRRKNALAGLIRNQVIGIQKSHDSPSPYLLVHDSATE